MRALVYKSTGSWYDTVNENGEHWRARMKGAFRIENITTTNPIAVGDWVTLQPENTEEGNTAMIAGIEGRNNFIIRQSPHNKNLNHIIAANLDQSVLLATLKDPKTSTGFIDRFLVTSEAYHIPAILVFNKKDLWTTKEVALFEYLKAIYTKVGYTVISISTYTNENIDELKTLLHNKTTLFSGHSGVGKSSLLNSMIPDLDQLTGDVSKSSGKGMHTTTFAQMFDIPEGGKIIDTPGVREFGIVNMDKEELAHYFPEMNALISDCQFNNCQHIREPKCAIKQELAKENPAISEERYLSYLNIYETLK
ncbi:ribosome small subunit-dependent GTPase A [Polluticaenibacter yanchengensis]|uniref:Small ribosomal subunit biogenesis GTPase RsgA n=1 Tax=Polluticaenibacter yanchengensis TaxID=3014562 RepID=A0ABT4UP59_9BACT|nr:ribosome small subunit-dependent GTPase A [Chitinophagaceae bacterium LY-5]